MGKPEQEDAFTLYKVGDIDAYIYKGVGARDKELKIKYSKFLWSKSLTVDGVLI